MDHIHTQASTGFHSGESRLRALFFAGTGIVLTLSVSLFTGCSADISSDLSQVTYTDQAEAAPDEKTPAKAENDEDSQPLETYGDSRDELIAVLEKAAARREGSDAVEETSQEAIGPDTSGIEAQLSSIAESYGANAAFAYRYLADSAWDFDVAGDASHKAASLISLGILTQVFDRIEACTLSLDDKHEITEDYRVGGNGTLQDAEPGTEVTVKDLIWHMLVESDNVATNMLIDIAGMERINTEIQRSGLEATSLERYMMDTAAQEQGYENRISANDAADILAAIARSEFYTEDLSDLALASLQQNGGESAILPALPEGTIIATKLGNLANVQNEAAIVQTDKPYVFVALVEGIEGDSALALITEAAAAVEAWNNA